MNMRRIFITGTDTNIGKTFVSIKLLEKFNQQGFKTIGIKPVATGSIAGYNQDALLLQQYSSIKLDYNLINPFVFTPAVSPNIASLDLTVDKIYFALQETLTIPADVYLVEGIGGWFTPLNLKETMADLVKKIEGLEIILVVGIRLGCLNHALLTYNAIKNAKLSIVGWIANIIDPEMEAWNENIVTLKKYITEPCLEIYKYEHA
jgi:dethiobiotin synthetase